jgi:hypothetical protein
MALETLLGIPHPLVADQAAVDKIHLRLVALV